MTAACFMHLLAAMHPVYDVGFISDDHDIVLEADE